MITSCASSLESLGEQSTPSSQTGCCLITKALRCASPTKPVSRESPRVLQPSLNEVEIGHTQRSGRLGANGKAIARESTFVYTIFFLSGAAALIYEISWSRQIGLLLGHTIHSSSIVLASYFAGMVIGYWLGARWCHRVSPLAGYGIAEIVVAVWAFAIPMLLGVAESSELAQWLSSPSAGWQTFSRATFCFFLLLPATTALGVTLPMIAEYFFKSNDDPRSGSATNSQDAAAARLSFAYALNTAGALAGVLLATFCLLIFVGVEKSSYLAAGISIACGLVAIGLSKSVLRSSSNRTQPAKREWSEFKSSLLTDEFGIDSDQLTIGFHLTLISFISGFCTLALQVLYTRMFSLVFHNSTYTFGIVVAVFLASLSIAAALAARLQVRFNCRKLIGHTAIGGAILIAASVIQFVWLTELKYFSYGNSFTSYMGGAIGLVTVIVAPGIICLGMTLPLVWAMAGNDGKSRNGGSIEKLNDRAGHAVGRLTAVNTLAAAAGALIASFVLLPTLGLWPSFVLVGGVYLMTGFWLLGVTNSTKENSAKSALLLGLIFATVSVFAVNSPIDSEYDQIKYGEKLIKRWNSAYGWIDVVQREKTGAFKIRQNLHYRFGTTGNNAREYRQAHIPLLLHPQPTDVLFVGLGTGLTAGGAVPHQDVEKIVAVELIPEVIEAVRLLADYNYSVVDHPKVEVFIDDARHHLLSNERNYDVIVSDLFVPWESETGYLYTVEHFQTAGKRLKQGGLFCQWLPLYQIGNREFKLIANSFANAFSNTTIWWGQLDSNSPVIALIGTDAPIQFDSNQIASRISELKQHVSTSDQSVSSLGQLSDHYIGDWEAEPGAKLNTDEYPRVEFLTPISNRNREMIRGKMLEQFYDGVLSSVSDKSVSFTGDIENELGRRRARQRTLLFGQ